MEAATTNKHSSNMIDRLKIYITKWWISILVFLLISLIGLVTDRVNLKILDIISISLVILSVIWVLVSIVNQFIIKKWGQGIISFFIFVVSFIVVIGIYAFYGMFVSEDTFANDLEIPDDIILFEPQEWSNNSPVDSSYQDIVLSPLRSTRGEIDSLTIDFTFLRQCFINQNTDLLKYLSTNPAWRVFQERGNKYATRRWNIDSNWKYTLHGYYTNFSLDYNNNELANFQNRFTLGLSGEPWIKNTVGATVIDMKEYNTVLTAKKEKLERFLVFDFGDLIVECFEESPFSSKVLSQAAFDYSKIEFEKVFKGQAQEIFPDSTIRCGEPVFNLHSSIQGGIYSSEIWINPGESGMIYLKAYEVTKNTELSTRGLEQYSNEWIGWSKNPNELFYSNTLFTIYEGDWGKPYAARFEIWFVPDSGDKERKLMQKIFKIEGWQR